MQPYTYLLIDLGCLAIPLLCSFYKKHPFFREWKSFFLANALVAIPFLIWDYFFTVNGIWGFNDDYITGVKILHLPIEEVLFFICIPYACVFTYFALQYLVKRDLLKQYHRSLSLVLIAVSLLFMIFGFNKQYTYYTGLFLGIFLIHQYWKKIDLSHAYLAFLVIYPFFIISNGLLTGTLLDAPIVWYNDDENLGLRMGTIPVEDSFYGLLLILLNITLFEKFRKTI